MKRPHLLAGSALVLAGTLGLAGLASAADDGSATRAASHLSDEQKCEHHDIIRDRATATQERIDTWQERLATRRAAAEAAGNTSLVERIDRVLERLTGAEERLAERLATFEEWVAEHC